MSHLDVLAEATVADEDALQRVRDRLLSEVADSASSHALLRHLPGLNREAEGRVRSRLGTAMPRRAGRLLVLGAGAAGSVALIAASALIGVAIWTYTADSEQPLLSELEWKEQSLVPGIHARFQGMGALAEDDPPLVTWDAGVIELAVDPEAGIDLTIRTSEAEIRVLGTVLSVSRDALGTEVRVDRGRVAVTCTETETTEVAAGENRLCLPTTAGGLLGRARTLDKAEAPSTDVLAAIEAGLEIAEGPIGNELATYRIQHLLAIEANAPALEYVEAYIVSGTDHRRPQMLRVAAELALSLHGCERALPYLRELEGDLTSRDEEMMTECSP